MKQIDLSKYKINIFTANLTTSVNISGEKSKEFLITPSQVVLRKSLVKGTKLSFSWG